MTASRPAVMIVHNKYTTQGGEEKMVELQSRLLLDQGHRVSTYFEDSALYANARAGEKIRGALQMPFSLRHYRALRQHLRAARPDVMHVHNVFPLLTPSVYYAAQAEGVPVVQSLHNYRWLCSNGLFLLPEGKICERCKNGAHWNAVRFGCYAGSRLRSAGMAGTLTAHRVLNTFFRTIAAYIAPSPFLKKKFVEAGFPDERIVVLPPGLPPLSVRPIPQQTKTLLFVGRLSREKGLLTLVAAAALRPDWTFNLAGDGALRSDIERAVAERSLRNVRLLGRLDGAALERAYQECTYLVLPSECYENLPTVILEAWFYGRPVIVSNLGGMAELVTEGRLGFQFPAGDPRALAALLERLTLNRSLAMKASIQEHFAANYTPDHFVSRLQRLYEKVLLKPS